MTLYRVATDEQEVKVGLVRRGYIVVANSAAEAGAKVHRLAPEFIYVVAIEPLEKDLICYQTIRARGVIHV